MTDKELLYGELTAQMMSEFKDALNAYSQKMGKPLEELLPSYARWVSLETRIVKERLKREMKDNERR